MEPENHLFERENHLPNLRSWVQGCAYCLCFISGKNTDMPEIFCFCVAKMVLAELCPAVCLTVIGQYPHNLGSFTRRNLPKMIRRVRRFP